MATTQTTPWEWAEGYFTDHSSDWAWANYESTVFELVRHFGLHKVLEIGGGRSPLFSPADFEALGADYTINDISQDELDAAPPEITAEHKICFDIAGSIPVENEYDLIYSKSVFEHVEGTMQAHRNTYRLLRPGGVSLHFYPTLFSPPFVANKLLPEKVASKILKQFVGWEYKKFPAHYDHCYSTVGLENKIRQVGYSKVILVPFWGHAYFHRIAGVREFDRWLAKKSIQHDFRPYSSFCFAVAQK